MTYAHLFSQSLGALDRLHMAAHSHHLWPDAAFEGQKQAFIDAARLADDKWDHVFGHVYPQAQKNVAAEISWPDPSDIVFAPNTHQLIVTLFSALDHKPIKLLTTDGEFHSLSRQVKRWAENDDVDVTYIDSLPEESFTERFLTEARKGDFDIIFTSQVFFGSGTQFDGVDELTSLSSPDGPWVVVDGYHGFMARPVDLSAVSDKILYLSGGYKYAMAGEGCAFMCTPKGFAPRPKVTGWYAAFGDLIAPPGGVGYAKDASRFMGATFDPSGLYRFNAVQDMLRENELTTAKISAYVGGLHNQLTDALTSGKMGKLSEAERVNSTGGPNDARFAALRHPDAQALKTALHEVGIVTDVRRDVLRIGLGLYHTEADIDRLIEVAGKL